MILRINFVPMEGYFYELEIRWALEDERKVEWMGKSGHIDLMLLDPINNIIVFRAIANESGENFYGWKKLSNAQVQGIMTEDDSPLFVFPSY